MMRKIIHIKKKKTKSYNFSDLKLVKKLKIEKKKMNLKKNYSFE